MEKDLSAHRKFYGKFKLHKKELPKHPITLFTNWFEEVLQETSIKEANAMTVSTIGLDGFPKGRVVLLKYYSKKGFIFFTNYNSEKGKSLLKNPKTSLSFFWPSLERQVIIKGCATKTSKELSDKYFNLRPRASRIGALSSNQSHIISSRTILEKKAIALQKQFKGKDIPRPSFWGGYNIKPYEIEFWQGRESRLHDRIRYKLQDELNWSIERLSP